jgi:hypothetical protein
MRKSMFALLALAISLFGTPCWAAICSNPPPTTIASATTDVVSCTNQFSPTVTTATYDFSSTGDGILIVQFKTVLTTFTLTATVNHTIDPLDPNEFPADTVCVPYSSNFGLCDQYDFTGSAGGPHGVPVKNTDYKGLITLVLSYYYTNKVHNPAFGHAPGDSTTITEDILTAYSTVPTGCTGPSCGGDPTMDGSTPGLSSVLALDEPLSETDTFCFVSPQGNQTFSVGQEIEVAFQLFSSGSCPSGSGTPIRDKTARLSVSTVDSSGNVIFPRLRNKEKGDKFHFDHDEGVNEFDLSTHRLLPGSYTITIFSSKFSPQSVNVNVVAGTDADDDPD